MQFLNAFVFQPLSPTGRFRGSPPGPLFLALGLENKKLESKFMHQAASDPNDLEKYFVERANAGDVEGLLALYEPHAVLVDSNGEVAKGLNQIREFFIRFLANRPQLEPSNQAAAICSGDIALTSSYLSNGDVTAEIARRQTDGSWAMGSGSVFTWGKEVELQPNNHFNLTIFAAAL